MNETVEKVKRGICGWCGRSERMDPGQVMRRHPGLDGLMCDGVGSSPPRTTAPVPRGKCGRCGTVQKLTRETGRVTRHGDCSGAGSMPTERAVVRDLRRGVPVIAAPAGADLVTREEVAQICGVTIRTVTRWVGLGYLTRYEDSRGRVAYARVQAEAMNRFEPVE